MYLYGPETTSFFGGEYGLGVPNPWTTNSTTHQRESNPPRINNKTPKYLNIPRLKEGIKVRTLLAKYGNRTRKIKVKTILWTDAFNTNFFIS